MRFQRLEVCAAIGSSLWKCGLAAALLFGAAGSARALGPHEMALLVNANSPASREVANHYIKLRGVPVRNVIYLDVPNGWGGGNCTISTTQFVEQIWTPTTNAIAHRRIGDHILAWIYSADFPTTISSPIPVSLHGMTFLRGQLIEPERIDKAKYASPFFRGPVEAGAQRGKAFSFEQFAMSLGTNLPLPAMTLGHLAPRGLTVGEIVESLKFSARADFSRPDPVVNFVMSDDVRSKCRAWQAPDLATEFAELGITSLITTNQADLSRQLTGLQMGAAEIYSGLRVKLAAGAMAEHLTSFGADFPSASQTKITDWLKVGASASAGTVTEPYALWTKFPHARFHAHYVSGCTMLESFLQSIGSPLQIFLLGDPLCRPFARQRSLTIVSLAENDEALKGMNEFLLVEGNGIAPRDMTFMYQIDGVTSLPAGNGTRARVDASKLSDGWHELRATGYAVGEIRHQFFATKFFAVRNHGHSVSIAEPDVKRFEPGLSAEIKIAATEGAERFELLAQGRALAEGTNATLSVDFASAGPGPVWIQAFAHYADGQMVGSRPRMVEIGAAAKTAGQ